MTNKFLRRMTGVYMIIIGLLFQLLNIITYGVFGIDIDVIGLFILILGLIIMVVWWKE